MRSPVRKLALSLLTLLALILSPVSARPTFAQTGLDTTDLESGVTLEDLVNTLLASDSGITIVPGSVEYAGAPVAAGGFTGGDGIIGFGSGIILSSGNVANVVGPNDNAEVSSDHTLPGNDLLAAISGTITLDAAVLEFDFVPEGNQVSFTYVFASDEYNEFANSPYNDVFAFFVNGTNYAQITTVGGEAVPVTINTINGGNPFGTDARNPEYYRNNDFQDGSAPYNSQMDGLTTVLTVQAPVNPGEQNHLVIAIADAVDGNLDSNVFIKRRSFTDRAADVALFMAVSDHTPEVSDYCVIFDLSVKNDGPYGTNDLKVGFPLPAGLTFYHATPSRGTYSTSSGIWNVGALASGEEATLTVCAKVNTADPIEVVAQVIESDRLDPDSTPNNNIIGEDDHKVCRLNAPNVPPSDITLSANQVLENSAIGTLVGYLAATDADDGDSHEFLLVDHAQTRFTVDNNRLEVSNSSLLDYETATDHTIRVRAYDTSGAWFEKEFTILVIDDPTDPAPPTDISLDNASVPENASTPLEVGRLSTVDPNDGDTHTYTLVTGEGDDDNASFQIVGDALHMLVSADYESRSSYSIRVRSTDADGLFYEEAFTISVTDVNEAPTAIHLSNASVAENLESGAIVGNLSTVDPDAGDIHSYLLVPGEGDSGNAAFYIDGNTLKTNGPLDYEAQSTYSVRVRVTDQGSLSYESPLTITVTDVNEAPVAIPLSSTSVHENLDPGTVVGAFSILDPDSGDTHTISLVPGDGSGSNGSFGISGLALTTAEPFDYETSIPLPIRVRATDSGGLYIEQTFTITVLDVNEPVLGVDIDNRYVDENLPAGAVVGNLISLDGDVGDTHTYALVDGEGGEDNAFFTIDGSQLQTAAVFDFETKSSYSVRVRSTDSGSTMAESPIAIYVRDVNEAPTAISLSNTSVAENLEAGATVGSLSAVDPDLSDDHTFALVPGEGDTGNGAFVIDGHTLKTNSPLDYEAQSTYSVRIRVTDTGGLSYETPLTISVTNVKEGPTGLSLDNASLAENLEPGAVVGNLSVTDPDVGDVITFAPVTGEGDDDNAFFTVSEGQLKAAVTFNYEARDSYSVRIGARDAGGLTTEAAFTITITDTNDAPSAAGDSLIVPEDGQAEADLLANDSDEDGDPITITGLSTPAHGTASLVSDSIVRYIPAPQFNGADSFTYTISDGNGGQATGTVSVTVTPVNDPPVAQDDAATTQRGVAVLINVLANDSDIDGDSLSVQSVGQPHHGTAQAAEGGIRYTPATGYTGTDSFTYTVSDGKGGTAAGRVSVTVEPPATPNPGSIAGAVFEDRDGDGLPDAGESPIAGVTITAYSAGQDGLLGTADDTVSAQVTTGADGRYRIDGLDAGQYLVVETQPAGYVSSMPDTLPLDVPAGRVVQAHFGEQRTGTIVGIVYHDSNGNGVRDAGEAGLSGVTLTLYGPGPDGRPRTADDPTLSTTLTDAEGGYAFGGLNASSYRVVETDPAGYVSSTSNDVTLALSAGGAASATFGDRAVGTVAGTVYEDRNGNGRQDLGEPGLGNVSITLFGAGPDGLVGSADDPVAGTATTDANGAYSLASVSPGRYLVRESDPAGYGSTTSNSVPITLGSGGAASAHFGDCPLGTVSGRVFSDLDGDGAWDPGEDGLSGVQVRLLAARADARLGTPDDVEAQAVTTDEHGEYRFAGAQAGNYLVRMTSPQGYVSTGANPVAITLTDGSSPAANFAHQPRGTIVGSVFDDLNGNGRRDPGELGLGGVPIELRAGGNTAGLRGQAGALATVYTASNGSYVFTGIQPGNYVVQGVFPAGYVSAGGNSAPVTLQGSSAAAANLAGMAEGTVRGSVFNDLDGDGDQGPAEPSLAGAPVELVDCGPDQTCGTDDDTVVATGTTDDEGRYSFHGVGPGRYLVRLTGVAGFSAGQDSAPVTMTSGSAAAASFGRQALGTIAGVVYDDVNSNRRRDPGERGIGGVTITLSGPGGTVQTLTNSSGAYLFTGLVEGAYTVQETDLAGYTSTTSNRVLVSMDGGAGHAHFGDRSPLYAGATDTLVFLPTFRQGTPTP